ncbi:protein kinase domain-containing protein [Haloferula sp.]|uniref:protein kinase domain-containing protein n=1 Tax=Haloferula sp. TaxID=2497595 RepID=UPI003C7768D8
MESPHLDMFTERELLGSGPSGAVFRAVKSDGSVKAVKLLDGMAINRAVLEAACARLERGGWPKGILRIDEADFRARPAARLTACLADQAADGTWRPRSLQHQLEEFPGERSWPVVVGLAEALASLHDRRVAHGNLKPGNVFIDDEGEVVLTDWALGHMPGIGHMEFTDACLYHPPEQLRSSDGYLEEEGYRWDVFAFGVMAYRLLTGMFPRCDATFQEAAPVSGETTRDGIAADLGKIANSLEAQASVSWPEEPKNALEEGYREVIDTCLALDPLARPANGMEIRRLLRISEVAVEEELKREEVLDQRRHSQRSAWRAGVAAGILAAAVVVLAMLWQLTRTQLQTSIDERQSEVESLTEQVDLAERRLDVAMKSEKEARETLQTESTIWLARIEESRSIGDRLFAWAMEKGNRNLPPLDGRELRLARLENYYVHFLERTAEVEGLEDERARARLQLAEISLASGDAEKAAKRLEEAIAVAGEIEEAGAELNLRLATDYLILALLRQQSNDPQTDASFGVARQALEAIPQAEVDADRVTQLLAILGIHESRQLAAAGEEAKALELLHRATEDLNRLVANRPEAAILRSELVSCYLSSATILDGMGEMGDARTVRSLAADVLVDLIKKRPSDLELRIELAGCYGAIAESSLIAGDLKNAEAMSKAAVKLLLEVLPQRPDSVVARSRLAAQRGLMAGILRDRGEREEAIELYDEGLRLIEGLTLGDDADPVARYRFALLTWEKGRMLGFSGDREKEITHEQKAVAILEQLLDDPYALSRGEQIRRSLGYVLGDMGHAAQLEENKELSAEAFSKAVKIWEELSRERPSNEEYQEALEWNRQRLGALD